MSETPLKFPRPLESWMDLVEQRIGLVGEGDPGEVEPLGVIQKVTAAEKAALTPMRGDVVFDLTAGKLEYYEDGTAISYGPLLAETTLTEGNGVEFLGGHYDGFDFIQIGEGANAANGECWAAAQQPPGKIKWDLGEVKKLVGFRNQGRGNLPSQHIKTLRMEISSDDQVWTPVSGNDFDVAAAMGPVIVETTLSEAVECRYITIEPITWGSWPSMRADMITQAIESGKSAGWYPVGQ